MPSVIRRRDEQGISPAELALKLDAGQESEQSPWDEPEAFYASLLQPELVRLCEMNTPASRRVIKIIMFMALREVCKFPVNAIRFAFTAADHLPIGLATTDRWTDAAAAYLLQREPQLENEALMLSVPARKSRETAFEAQRRAQIAVLMELDKLNWREQWEQDYATVFGAVPSRKQAVRVPKQKRPAEVAPKHQDCERQMKLFG